MRDGRGPGRTLVLGAGLMGRWHAAAARRAGARTVAFVDPDLERARRLASRTVGVLSRGRPAEAFADLDEALAAVSPEVAHVCTPPDTHVELVRRCLEAGLHTLVEKPVADSALGARTLVEVARGRDLFVCPVYQTLFQRGASRFLERPDAIGDLLHVDLEVRTAGAEGLDTGGRDAVVAEILPHPLSFLDRLSRDRLPEATWTVRRSGPGELRATAGLPDGEGRRTLTASILVSTTGRPPVHRIQVVGTEATVHLDLFHGFASLRRIPAGRLGKALLPFADAAGTAVSAAINLAVRTLRGQVAYPGLWELVDRFYEAVAGRGATPLGPGTILRVADARDRLLKQAGLRDTALGRASSEERA